MKHKHFLLSLALTCFITLSASAKVVLPNHFTNNMLLQQKRTLTIKGTASPRSTVTLNASWGGGAEADWLGHFTCTLRT